MDRFRPRRLQRRTNCPKQHPPDRPWRSVLGPDRVVRLERVSWYIDFEDHLPCSFPRGSNAANKLEPEELRRSLSSVQFLTRSYIGLLWLFTNSPHREDPVSTRVSGWGGKMRCCGAQYWQIPPGNPYSPPPTIIKVHAIITNYWLGAFMHLRTDYVAFSKQYKKRKQKPITSMKVPLHILPTPLD